MGICDSVVHEEEVDDDGVSLDLKPSQVRHHKFDTTKSTLHKEWLETFTRMGLSDTDINSLYSSFRAMDIDKSGEISVYEFFDFFELENTSFSRRAFLLFDVDDSKEIDFLEFVSAIWNYCTYEEDELVRFAFNLYDSDGSGHLDIDEAKAIVRAVCSKSVDVKDMKRMLSDMDKYRNEIGEIGLPEFRMYVANHDVVLSPVRRLQTILKKKVIGERFWNVIKMKRKAVIESVRAENNEVFMKGRKNNVAMEKVKKTAFIRRTSKKDLLEKNKPKKTRAEEAEEHVRQIAAMREKKRLAKNKWAQAEDLIANDTTPLQMILSIDDPQHLANQRKALEEAFAKEEDRVRRQQRKSEKNLAGQAKSKKASNGKKTRQRRSSVGNIGKQKLSKSPRKRRGTVSPSHKYSA